MRWCVLAMTAAFVLTGTGLAAASEAPETDIALVLRPGATEYAEPEFAVVSDDPGAHFECRDWPLDAPWISCAPEGRIAPARDGISDLRAVSGDGTADPTSVDVGQRARYLLHERPSLTWWSHPINDRSPVIGLHDGAGQVVTWWCRLPDGPWESCPGSYSFHDLADGTYSLMASGIDAAGRQTSVGSSTFVIDTQAPEPTLTPDAPVRTNDAPYLQSSDWTARLQWRVDGGPWMWAATSGVQLPPLPEGPHTFDFIATDRAGNASPPGSHSFVIDTTAPRLTLTTPSGYARLRPPPVHFVAEEGATIDCRVDLGGWKHGCSSPYLLPARGAGDYRLDIRATDQAGNLTTETVGFRVLASPPDTWFMGGPKKTSRDARPRIRFGSFAETPRFECRLDKGPWRPCTSGQRVGPLKPKKHTLSVRAVDETGWIDPTPAVKTWTVLKPRRS